MNAPLYIHAATAISPQQTYEPGGFLKPVQESAGGRLRIIDADYARHISPVAIRRMSRALKMAITAAMQCLKEAAITTPDAIITGSGRGSVSDMETLVKDMIRLNEEALNPTLFIQSTYNSPNGWIAMQSKCTGYNQTYVHRGCSFELALLDAQLLIAEDGKEKAALVGCYDEITDEHFIIKRKIGYWKTPVVSSLQLFQHAETPGSIGGEGSAFFLLSGERKTAATKITGLRILQNASAAKIETAIAHVLVQRCLKMADIDFVLTGMSGDVRYQPLYSFLDAMNKEEISAGAFKHLCGEFDTATGFGLWLADYLMRTQEVPAEILLDTYKAPSTLQRILLVNHYHHGSASLTLLERA